MPNTNLKIASGLVLAWLVSSTAWAETFQHSPITPIPPQTAPLPATPMVAAPTPMPAPVPAPMPQITRAAFTSAISGREPVDQLTHISAGQQVYYFTELVGLQGHVINHKWERNGAFQLGLQFPVSGSPWRVNSSKSISVNLPGIWTVTVQNDDGSILRRDTLVVDPAMQAPTAMPAAPTVQPPPAPAIQPPPAIQPAPAVQPPPTVLQTTPVIPPPAQPLTPIPPELQREPAPRPTSPEPSDSSETPTSTPSSASSRPIWETLPR
ncbi:MAG: DUF2914 domain-containing protein [Thiothrix sp.]|uniref:DUF2914 domain-containing protein n=1 Tax=Thiothrix sp. TaxID=1032 RepID=UPI00262B0509|nr:DUF2914 domain-containing protein [Thiothrix sp.]MDD5393447.1 DUF2914 domain-containing protein [Thiothrix sp.]